MLFKGSIDHDPQTIAGMIGSSSDDTRTENDMTPVVPMNQAIHHLHRHCGLSVNGFTGPFAICWGEVGQDKLKTAAPIHRLSEC